MVTDDSSMEFDLYENARKNLRRHLEFEGYEILEAERIALYVIQGVRCVPRLLMLLGDNAVSSDVIRGSLQDILDNYTSLDKARVMLRDPKSS